MVTKWLQSIWATAALCVLLCGRSAFADDSATVRVKYPGDETEIGTVEAGARFFSDRDFTFSTFPSELGGLKFTRRPDGRNPSVIIDAPNGANVYVLFGDGSGGAPVRKAAEAAGFISIGTMQLSNRNGLVVYKLTANEPKHLEMKGAGLFGILVAAMDLTVDSNEQPAPKQPDASAATSTLHTDSIPDAKPTAGPTTRIANPQATIKALEILEMGSGLMLGQTSEAVLTVTPGDSPKQVSVRFVTKVGDEMCLARDEALRFIRVKYPNWNADNAEITFEDKYAAHDGGSIGTAIATNGLSTIQGFTIDPNVAVTGDISANGKVRAIGGVSAKIRGAIASNCTLVAIPMDNQGQLVDAVTYSGPALLSDIQVIGISSVDDAVATVRTDRDSKLSQAIAIFGAIQLSIKNDPGYLKKPDAKEKLSQVLALAPQHLSARLLLDVITGKQPKTLSATASFYYTSLAVRNMLAVLNQRDKWRNRQLVPSGVVRIGLSDLHKLMPLADANVKPLINAWMQFIEAWSELQQGEGSAKELDARAQTLTDEMAKEDTNADLMQKTLKEGF